MSRAVSEATGTSPAGRARPARRTRRAGSADAAPGPAGAPGWDAADPPDSADAPASAGPAGSGRRSGPRGPADTDPEEVARQICLRMLESAPRTRAQLASALHRRGVPDEAAEAVLQRFAEVQLIDDAMFAQAWVDSRHHGRGLARRALAAELRQRGVPAEDIQAAVGRLDPEQEYATARALVERRLAATRSLPKPARFRRLMGVLARKGYAEGLAYRVVREALDQEPAGFDPAELPGPEPEDDITEW
jgi:regulatory protein